MNPLKSALAVCESASDCAMENAVSDERKPWAIVAFKDKHFGGVISPELGTKQIRTFCGEFASDGYTIKPVYDRAEYLTFLESLKHD